MSNGPLPTHLVFLSDLPTVATGTKVRFLGCVTEYIVSTGILTLQHAYPLSHTATVTALVQMQLVLENIKREDMAVGAWVNVMGYVEGVVGKTSRTEDKAIGPGGRETVNIGVKAVMLWNAGGVKIGEYERALANRLACK